MQVRQAAIRRAVHGVAAIIVVTVVAEPGVEVLMFGGMRARATWRLRECRHYSKRGQREYQQGALELPA